MALTLTRRVTTTGTVNYTRTGFNPNSGGVGYVVDSNGILTWPGVADGSNPATLCSDCADLGPDGASATYTATVPGSPPPGTYVTGFTVTRHNVLGGGGSVRNIYGEMILHLGGDGPITGCYVKSNDGKTCPGPSVGMAAYAAHLMAGSLHIEDTPFRYQPARGPAVNFNVAYNQRDSQPSQFTYSNLGPQWTFNWLAYVTDDPSNLTGKAGAYVRGGGTEVYNGFNVATQSYAPDAQSQAVLVRTGTAPITYEKRYPDGSKEVYALSDNASSYPRKVFMTAVVDPAGNSVAIGFDSSFRVLTLTDALGYVTTLSYELSGDPLKITKVTEPFPTGRTATFAYTNGQLTTITDEIGIQSVLNYTSGTNFIDTLTTPYGTSNFATGQNGTNAWIEMTDPLGGKERVEYLDNAPGIGSSESTAPSATGITNSGLNVANSFYWDKKTIHDYPPVNGVYDYTKARITHWTYDSSGKPSGVAASEKPPLESRIWYTYAGQSDSNHAGTIGNPSQVARVLDDSSTQLSQYTYNTLGKVTQAVDPIGRTTIFNFDTNNIDLLTVQQKNGATNDLLRTLTYNSFHEPLTDKDAAGETTQYGYNGYGQLTSVQNAKSETTNYGYGDGNAVPLGYLASITSPIVNGASAVTNFTYDSANRVRTVTNNPDGYTVTRDYDNLDRVTQITYPDTTTKQFQYAQDFGSGLTTILDLTKSKDRRGLWTTRHYDANRHMDSITDPLNRATLYGWCNCGALLSITDANNHTTIFNRDIESRVTSKVFADTKSTSYVFENSTSRLKSMTDAKNQTTNYQYFGDDDLKQVSYTNAVIATPTVSFTYDTVYNRVKTMVDGNGTTNYAYNPITGTTSPGAEQLLSVDGPLANDTITYAYDALGRELSHAVNAVSASQAFDPLGRVSSVVNPLGTFTPTYDGPTARLLNLAMPNSQSTAYSYFGNTSDRRLQTINNKTSAGAIVSKFDYQYDAEGEITQLTRQFGTTGYPEQWFGVSGQPMLDNADQLVGVSDKIADDEIPYYTYSYDGAGNKTDFGAHTYNTVNQLTDAGYAYDNNGNLTADPARTYEWDAADRLTAINYTGITARTEFTYDGLSRRVKIVEKGLGTPAITLSMQPTSTTAYTVFTSTQVSLAAGTYVLAITGLNPNGGTNSALIDSVTMRAAVITGGSFESPALAANTYQLNPSSPPWTFTGTSGISRNKSSLMGVNAPQGAQVGLVQNTGSISQTMTLTAGNCAVKISAAQAKGNTSSQTLQATLTNAAIVVTSTKQFIWNGTSIAEERDASNTVLRRFYAQGEQISGAANYYMKDHLGSIVEMNDSSGAVKAEYAYDWWGNRTKRSGTLDSEFGYTGFYYHQPSGLNLALYRSYDVSSAKWISRDPLSNAELMQGPNLYTYVRNDPSDEIDPNGLWQITIGGGYGYAGLITFGHNNGQWNASGTVGYGIGGIFGFNPNDNTQGHTSGDSLHLGVAASGSIGVPDLVEGGGGFSVTGEINHCADYWYGTTVDGGIGNIFLGGVSGSAWGGVGGNVGDLSAHPAMGRNSNGWGWSVGGLAIVGATGGATW